MLRIQNISFRLGGRALFERATLSIQEGQKIGLVGRNGTGKTTLLRLIQGDITPDNGSIEMSPRTIIGTVAQEAPAGQASLLDTVLAADTERESLLRESETAKDPARIADIHTRLADMDAHAAPARAAAILSGLGFDEDAQHRPCSDYSGGWRMRVALAATLFMRPTLLLLDEPTNHLDLEAVLWLESHLAKWQGSILLVSHERGLLNRAVKEIVHLENTKLMRYTGGYDDFERIRREKLSQQSKLHTRQIAERKRIQAFIDRFRYKPTKARQAQSRIKLLEKMEPIASVIEESTLSFEFPQPDPLSPPLISLENISAGYEDVTVLRDLNMRIDMDDRIALLGANGREVHPHQTARRQTVTAIRQANQITETQNRLLCPTSDGRTQARHHRLRPSPTRSFQWPRSPVCEPNWDASVSCNQKQIPKCRTFLGERRRVFFSAS